MQVAITGAGGFVGQALCRTLAAEGYKVIACIRSGDRPEGASEVRRIADIADRDSLGSAFDGADRKSVV